MQNITKGNRVITKKTIDIPPTISIPRRFIATTSKTNNKAVITRAVKLNPSPMDSNDKRFVPKVREARRREFTKQNIQVIKKKYWVDRLI